MAEQAHKIGDRRRHGLGDNTRTVPHPHKIQVKQASKAKVSQSSVFRAGTGGQWKATGMPRTAPKPKGA
jgi:hypothetical protein